MSRAKIICIIILCAGSSLLAGAQTPVDIERLSDVHTPRQSNADYSSSLDRSGGMKSVLSFFFLSYKRYISSQDGMNCVFHPSCSVYAMESVKESGVLKGGLAALDRLTRCHGFSSKQYPVHPVSKRLYDPVK